MARYMKFCIETNYNLAYKIYIKIYIINIVTVQNFEVMFNKFNVGRICT